MCSFVYPPCLQGDEAYAETLFPFVGRSQFTHAPFAHLPAFPLLVAHYRRARIRKRLGGVFVRCIVRGKSFPYFVGGLLAKWREFFR